MKYETRKPAELIPYENNARTHTPEQKELREGGKWGPNDRIEYPYKDARNRVAASMSGRLKC